MSHTKFHMAWFTNARPHGWGNTGYPPDVWAGNDVTRWETGEFLVDMARDLDRAGFDYLMLEDHVAGHKGEYAEPRLDPVPLLPLLAQATEHLGVVATMSTSFYPPFMLARLCQTLDLITRGRVGWNVVTTSEDSAAQAFGHEKQPGHDQRYVIAEEYLDLVHQLWAGWEPGAVVADRETNRYLDDSKLHPIDYEGEYFKSKGLLNVAPGPQGRPVICQAGSSPEGRDFGAKWSDTFLFSTGGADDPLVMKEIRDDMRLRMAGHGRNPDDGKVMFMITPIIAETEKRAWDLYEERFGLTDEKLQSTIAGMSSLGDVDLSKFDLDKPLPPIENKGEGHRGTFGGFLALGKNGTRTLREMVQSHKYTSLDLVGTPESVADRMVEVMDVVGGDGYLIQSRPLTRHYVSEIVDGLIPELQKRGAVRTSYDYPTLRENLRAF